MKALFYAVSALFLCIQCATVQAYAAGADTILRIGLYYEASALPAVTLESTDGFALGTVSETVFVPSSPSSPGSVTVTADDAYFTVTDAEGRIIHTSAQDHLALKPNGKLTRLGSYSYDGYFVLRRTSSGMLTVINYVSIEDYVKGVLPYEVYASWPGEALKAQAVCTRSYALGNLNKHKALGFDLCNTTNCQVYRGIERATAASDDAVTATAGQYLIADGKPAIGFFFSSSGGATEDNENVWGGKAISYLRGVEDPYEDSAAALNGSWRVTLTADDVAAKLRAAGHSIGTVSHVQITERTAVSNVKAVTITDTNGQTVTLKNSAVRTVFGLNSMRYSVSGGKTSAGKPAADISLADGVCLAIGGNQPAILTGAIAGKFAMAAAGQQALALLSNEKAPADAFTFTGTGWGHHVGMSQHGALGMAKQGFTYDQILKFYFTGIEIAGI